jgi:processive 1,2-diacylglycerol beta-glucosyltransferase
MVRICAINELSSGNGYHRIRIPFKNLNKNKDFDIISTNAFSEEVKPEDFDIIVLNRFYPYDVDHLQRAKDSGAKIIVDIDNWIEYPDYFGFKDKEAKRSLENKIKESINFSDEIWAASPKLVKELSNIYPDKNIVLVENGIDFEEPQFQRQDVKRNDKFTIGWLGGLYQFEDVKKLIEPFEKIIKNKKHEILLAGYDNDPRVELYWKFIEQIFTSGRKKPMSQYKRMMRLDPQNYAIPYNLIDLALAPMNHDFYTSCKSNIRILEAGAFSIPLLVSNVEPFRKEIEMGLVDVSSGEWDKRIKFAIEFPEKAKAKGERLHDYVRSVYDISYSTEVRTKQILNLI